MDEMGIQKVANKLPKHLPTGKREAGKTVPTEHRGTVSIACTVSAACHFIYDTLLGNVRWEYRLRNPSY